MINTVIFDVGKVLVEYDWRAYLDTFGFEDETKEKVGNAVFDGEVWPAADRGRLSDKEYEEQFVACCPECREEILAVLNSVGETITTYSYAEEWIEALKKSGYRVYILSNYSKRLYEATKEKLLFEEKTDGAIFSWQVKAVKPEQQIFDILFEQFQINPAEAVFIDDLQENLEGAEQAGLHTILFKSHEQAQDELEKMGVVTREDI